MKAKKLSLAITLLSLICLSACSMTSTNNKSNNTSTTSSSKKAKSSIKTVEELLDKADTANDKVSSVQIDMELTTYINSNKATKNQKMHGLCFYDGYELAKGKVSLEEKQDNEITYEGILMTGDKDHSVYGEDGENGKWIQTGSGGEYYIEPDYFKLLNAIQEMSDDLKLTEEGDDYVLTLKNQDIDVMGLIGEQYNLSLTGITQDQLKKKFEIHFDKENYFLKDFSFSLKHQSTKGKLNIEVDTKYSKWNKLDEKEVDSALTEAG
ncbi:MAG: hypothetical protein Q4A90_06875 [Streptococcus sp.]|nr:hypothetical protein [Streptococcus sp.]